MSYNRWMPVQCSSELYHHGVKGMKWGKHIFGKGAEVQASGGGGGGNELSEEDKKLLEEWIAKYGPEKAHAMFVEKQQKEGKTIGPSFYELNKDKMHYKVGDMDTDARVRRYTAEGRERFRQNGKYRNMNLTDVYGENSKVNGNVGKNGANLYKMMDVDDVHDGKNYSTRDFDTSKHNDGKYGLKDKIREKVTGKADPDRLKQKYNDYVRDFERHANQKQAYSVGMEEEYVRKQAKRAADNEEQKTYDKSLAKIADKITGKKREFSFDRPLLSKDATNKDTMTTMGKSAQNVQRNTQAETKEKKNPHPNLPRSRKRNVTGKGTGVHIGQTVLPPEPKPLMLITDTNRPTSRKRKVTGKGTGVHVHGPGLNGGRKR